MTSLTRAAASLVVLPFLLAYLVAAFPATDPLVTPAAKLVKRDSANVIGYSLDNNIWDTRSCNNGFFSTIGGLGNCCADSSCDFITTCADGFVYYDSGTSADCGQVCGTGTVFRTAGDADPLLMYNCQSDWDVTMTTSVAATTPIVVTTTAPVVVTTTQQGTTVTVATTPPPAAVTIEQTSTIVVSSTTAEEVTLTVTSPDGSKSTSTGVTTVVVIASIPSVITASRSPIASASGSSTGNTGSSVGNTGSSVGNTGSSVGNTGSSAGNTGSSAGSSAGSNQPQPQHNSTSSSSKKGIMAGAIVGGVAAIAIVAAVIVFLIKRKSQNRPAGNAPGADGPQAYSGQPDYMAPVVGAPTLMVQNNPPPWQRASYGPGDVSPVVGPQQQNYKVPNQTTVYVAPSPPVDRSQVHEMYGGPAQYPTELSADYRR